MMKKTFLLLFILSFTSFQVMALNCGVNCLGSELFEQNSVSNTEKSAHECCHGKEDKKESENSPKCMDELAGNCMHEVYSISIESKLSTEESIKTLLVQSSYAIIMPHDIYLQNRYLPKKPYDAFIRHKAHKSLYIQKDQFLI